MGAGSVTYQGKRLTATGMVVGTPPTATAPNNGQQSTLHIIAIGSMAATAVVAVYDDTQTASPVAGKLRYNMTAPAGGVGPTYIQLDMLFDVGIAVVITVAAADITFIFR